MGIMEIIGPEIRNKINEFCRALLYEPKEFYEMRDSDEDQSDIIYSDKILLDKFNRIVALLIGEFYLEYLSDKEKETRFRSFASNIISEIDLYKREPKKIDEKIDEFIKNIVKPVNEIEFFFPIKNLKIKGNEFEIGNVILKSIAVPDFKILIRGTFLERDDPFAGRYPATLAVVMENGNNLELMTERAIKKVDLALDILRVSLQTEQFLHDSQTLFTRTDLTLFRRKGELGKTRHSWNRGFKPSQLEIDINGNEKYQLYLKELSDISNIEFISKDLFESLKKTTIWIGRSITEKDIDLKIIYLCVALESILTSRNEGRKGEALAYRMLLLHFCAGKFFLFPEYVLNLYDLRSIIIHQGAIGIATKDNYNTLRYISTEILINSILIIKNNDIKNYNGFMEKLESKEMVKEVRSWLENYSGDSAKEILDWINKK